MDNLNVRSNYVLTFEKLPQVAFYTQTLSIPSVTLGESLVSNPVVDYSLPGDKLIYEKFTIEFLVDENLNNYGELYNWLMEMRNPESNEKKDVYSDSTVTVLTNNKNPLRTFKFYDMFPIAMEALNFDFAGSASEPQVCSTTLSYTYFKLV